MKGYFITFEGPDGSGKTTQINLLKEYLVNKGHDVIVTREPGGTPISEAIRNIILDTRHKEMNAITEMLLYAAARAQHVAQLIKPALDQGKIVLCDRFVDSSVAYQGVGRNLGIEMIEEINKVALQGIVPDLTLFFDIEPEKGLKRGLGRDRKADRLEQEDISFHKKVYQGFCMLCQRYPERFKRINADADIEEIHCQIIYEIEQLPKYGK
ncbi:MAG: dTMP kinase [Caldicoprobacterales bacterium]|jgi:dTMP kinase|nr:dTMP kinase [Clostridiales bacterium]